MYRSVIPVLLCTIAVAAAPQDTFSSDITYVKINPVTEETSPPKSPYRESRIENLPLTIPGNYSDRSPEKNNSTKRESSHQFTGDDSKLKNDKELAVNDGLQPDNTRKVRSDDTTSSYETETEEPTEAITESVDEIIKQTEEYETRTRAPAPRFLSKLSYFKKEEDVRSSIATNLLERTGKRGFKSKCRCERIWNCTRLQITVPRCPTDYYLCC